MKTLNFRNVVTVGAIVLTSLLLGACRHGPAACTKPGIYTEARSIPPLQIPTGLQAPDTRGALRIPELNEAEAARTSDAPCLEQPPRYAPNARLVTPAAEKKANKRNKNKPAPATPAAPAPPAPAR